MVYTMNERIREYARAYQQLEDKNTYLKYIMVDVLGQGIFVLMNVSNSHKVND